MGPHPRIRIRCSNNKAFGVSSSKSPNLAVQSTHRESHNKTMYSYPTPISPYPSLLEFANHSRRYQSHTVLVYIEYPTYLAYLTGLDTQKAYKSQTRVPSFSRNSSSFVRHCSSANPQRCHSSLVLIRCKAVGSDMYPFRPLTYHSRSS